MAAAFSQIVPGVPRMHYLDTSWAFAAGQVPDRRAPARSGEFQGEVLSEVYWRRSRGCIYRGFQECQDRVGMDTATRQSGRCH